MKFPLRLTLLLASVLACGALTACDDDDHARHTHHGYHRDNDRHDDHRDYDRGDYRRDTRSTYDGDSSVVRRSVTYERY